MKRLIPICLVLSSCAASNGLDGATGIVRVADEPPSSACEFGGVKIQSGLDTSGNGLLDPDEVDDAQYICNGGESNATLTRGSSEAAGANCEFGGVRIDLGEDLDENGALGDEEVNDTEYVCNGSDGEDGMDGMNGTNGMNGADGDDGLGFLTSVVNVPANGACGAQTGVRIQAGPDANGNGTLDAAEVTNSDVVCDGADGTNGTGGTGGALIASSYAEAEVRSNAAPVTIVSVTISVPGPGTVVAFGSTDAYCSSQIAPRCDSGGSTPAYVRVVNGASGDPSSGTGWGYVHLADNTTENVQRSNTFNVAAAGSYTFYLRGEAQFASVGFWRSQINAVFVPN